MKTPAHILTSPLLLLSAARAAVCGFSQQCTSLGDTLASEAANTTVRGTEFVQAGANVTAASTHPTCAAFGSVVDYSFCRVRLTTRTGEDSSVDIEAWLPLNWTGRFLAVGNGGLGGCIAHTDLNYGAQRGFAVVGTNNGHDGNTGEPFLGKPGVVEDFAYRALRTGVTVGKQATETLYGKKHDKAYYLGCSTGGRQGFMEAQNFPEDFDGIVAGAPAFDFTALQVFSDSQYGITGPPGSATFLTPAQWKLVVNDTLAQCDGLDGHVDTVIEDPNLCQYRPERLLCAPGQAPSDTCLTGPQAETVRRVSSPIYDKHGKLVYPRMQPGVDASGILWNGRPFVYAADWWKYFVYEDLSYDGNVTLDDIEAARNINNFNIDAFDGDLSGARDSGLKILHYHGLQDALISSDNSARYYDHVVRTMGLRTSDLDEFYRYFRISGMGHCRGGSGASAIGNNAATLAGEEADKNVLTAIVKWVEEGEAPEAVLGTAFEADGETVKFQRRHCKYPGRNVYKGGDADLAESWECV
jgi:feruloyl esterase